MVLESPRPDPSESNHLSFAAQALHYFRREHESLPLEPVGGAAAWKGGELARRDDWIWTFGSEHVAELEAALAQARAAGLSMARLRRESFPLPSLEAEIARWISELRDGRGFVLLRGLPVERWGDEDAAFVFWGLGLHLGRPGAQNPRDELLGSVIDTGEEASNPNIRRYQTSGDIRYHCDLADVVGLLCLRTASRGGASRIASSVSVHDELLARRPDLTPRLFEPFLLDGRGEEKDGRLPYFPVPPCRFAKGRLQTFYHSDYFRSVTRHPGVPPFTAEEMELLDLYEEIANSPELRLDMQFEPGDVQLISNHTVLHARTAYVDPPEPGRRRHLLRLWLSLDG